MGLPVGAGDFSGGTGVEFNLGVELAHGGFVEAAGEGVENGAELGMDF